jgi:hypothetical protein
MKHILVLVCMHLLLRVLAGLVVDSVGKFQVPLEICRSPDHRDGAESALIRFFFALEEMAVGRGGVPRSRRARKTAEISYADGEICGFPQGSICH